MSTNTLPSHLAMRAETAGSLFGPGVSTRSARINLEGAFDMNRNRISLALVAALIGAPAFAAGPDFTTLTSAVDFTTVGTAILAIAALMVVPKVVGWGAKKVMGFIRG